MLVYALVAGVLFGLYFSLVGIGLNLVFGVMRIVNLAHGDFLMLGAFVAFGVVALAGIDPLFAVPLAFVIFLVVGPVALLGAGAAAAGFGQPGDAVDHPVLRAVAGDRGGDDDLFRHQRALDPEPGARHRVLDHQGQAVRRQARQRRRPDPYFRPGFSRLLGDRGRHQPDRDRAASMSICTARAWAP